MSPELYRVLLLIPVFLFSLCVHEFAHAWVAFKRGDPTAQMLGRLNLNPFSHADLFGTFILPAMGIYYNLPVFGWAKPVPVDMRNLKHGFRDMALVAIAGPVSNVLLALIATGVLSVVAKFPADTRIAQTIGEFCLVGIQINVMLAVFNMLPLPPLDGFRVVQGLFKDNTAHQLARLERFGMFLLIALFLFGGTRYLAIPIIYFTKLLIGVALS